MTNRTPSLRPIDLYFVLTLLTVEIIGRSPQSLRRGLTSLLGTLTSTFSRAKRDDIEQALSEAFPDGDVEEVRDLVRPCMTDFWTEFQHSIPWLARREAGRVSTLIGQEHLDNALQEGRGAILLESNGFGRRAIARAALHARGFSAVQVHGPDHLGLFAVGDSEPTRLRRSIRRFLENRERPFVREILTIPREPSPSFGRSVLSHLGGNGMVLMQGDGRHGKNLVRLPFLGGPSLFAPGAIKFARLAGAPVLPLFAWSRSTTHPNGEYLVEIGRPLPKLRGKRPEEVQAVLEDYAARLESHIRQSPGQYRNWHMLRAHLPID